VDITYERLASTLAIRQEPDRPRQTFDAVDVLQQAIFDLPQEDADVCELSGFPPERETTPFYVSGWPEQLRFAFRSLLGYALFQRASASNVQVRLRNSDGKLRVILSVPDCERLELFTPPTRRGQIDAAEQRAREVASLAFETVELAVTRHKGQLFEDRTNSTLTFTVELAQT
jgi:hypothetical protein